MKYWVNTLTNSKVMVEADYKGGHPNLTLVDFGDKEEQSPVVDPVVAHVVTTVAEPVIDLEREEAAKEFERVFGRKPHPLMKTENILKAVEDHNKALGAA